MGQFVITVSDEYYSESAIMDLYSKKTRYEAKKLAEYFGNRRKRRKEKNSKKILLKTPIL